MASVTQTMRPNARGPRDVSGEALDDSNSRALSSLEKNAAVGRLVADYSAAKKRRAALMSEAHQMGEALDRAATVMRGLEFYQEFWDGRQDGYQRNKAGAHDALKSYVTVDKAQETSEELRIAGADVRRLRKLIKDSGLDAD